MYGYFVGGMILAFVLSFLIIRYRLSPIIIGLKLYSFCFVRVKRLVSEKCHNFVRQEDVTEFSCEIMLSVLDIVLSKVDEIFTLRLLNSLDNIKNYEERKIVIDIIVGEVNFLVNKIHGREGQLLRQETKYILNRLKDSIENEKMD